MHCLEALAVSERCNQHAALPSSTEPQHRTAARICRPEQQNPLFKAHLLRSLTLKTRQPDPLRTP